MKKILFLILSSITFTHVSAQDHVISGKIKGMMDGEVLMGYYYGNKQYVKDTVEAKNESFEFISSNKFDKGMYFILLPDQQYFQILIDKTMSFSLESNIKNLIAEMKIKGSSENEKFYQYQKYTLKKGIEASKIKEELDNTEENSFKKYNAQEKLENVNKQVKDFKEDFTEKNSDTFFTKLLKAMDPIIIPESPLGENGKIDERFAFNYFKKHYWDHFDLTDDRMIRTPIFHEKMEKYLNEYTLQAPDSINKSLDDLIEKVRASSELFKYVINWATHHYESSKIMGQDAVFVHLVFTYFITQQTPWIDQVKLTNIIDKAMRISPNLIGTVAPFLEIPDERGQNQSLHEIDAPFTVLFFYDPDCGHCKTETPKVKEIIENYANNGVKMYAVCTEFDKEMWQEFIIDQAVESWINVIDIENKSNFRGKYNIMGTPRLYLLDANKKIIAKQIDSIALNEILENEFKKLNLRD
jgi:thiol-disulfide isomerase/thioredoxin